MTFVQGTFRAGALVAVVAALGAAPQVQTPRQTPRQTQTPAPAPTPTLHSASTDRVLYIHAGAVLDRPGQPPRGPSTIVIRGGRIDAVREGYVAPLDGARLIDLKGQFVLPGLIDAHVHIFADDDKMRARLEVNNRDVEDAMLIGVDNARRTLEAGFTTVRDLGSDVHGITALRDGIAAGVVPGPMIVAAGSGISGSGGHADAANNANRDIAALRRARATNTCDGADACRRAVRQQISQGADVIKFTATGGVMSNVAGGLGRQLFDDEMKAIVDTARLYGRKVAAHAHGADGIAAALRAGVDSIEHATFTNAETNALFKASDAWLVPTMVAPHAALAQARAGTTSKATLAKAEETVVAHNDNIAKAIEDGVRIAFGTDSGVSEHARNAREFALLIKAGMTPAAAIRAATVDAATLLDRSGQIGSLEPGKQADLIAVATSPLDDVTVLERVRFVMRRGVVHVLDGARQAFPPP
jgi:imidazolonepropionase-like amidohydrolase